LVNGRSLRDFTGARGSPLAVALSPDGALAAGAGGGQEIQIWEVNSGRAVRQYPIKSHVIRMAFVGKGTELVSAETDGRICHWSDDESTPPMCFVAGQDAINQAAFSGDGSFVAVVTRLGAVDLFNMTTGLEIAKLDVLVNDVVAIDISADGTRALLGCADKTVRLWDLTIRHELAHTTGTGSYISCVSFAPDASVAVFGSDDGEVAVWRLK
jgi:WD40 repeat protein